MSVEEAESTVQRLLKEEGKFKQKNIVVVLTGLMEAGKTTLLHRVFGKDLPQRYNSTGVAEKSWWGVSMIPSSSTDPGVEAWCARGLKQYTVDMKEFQLLESPKDLLELVAQIKLVYLDTQYDSDAKPKTHTNTAQDSEETSSVMDEELTENKLRDEEHKAVPSKSIVEVPADELQLHPDTSLGLVEPTETNAHVQGESHAGNKSLSMNKLVNMVRMYPNKCYVELKIVHLIDTGGQPECLEVLPTLVHNSDLILLVVDLTKHLDKYTVPTFHKQGCKYTKERLLTCNKQIIEQIAQTMVGKSNSKILVVATHKDQAAKQLCLPTNLKELDKFTEKIIAPESLIPKTKDQNVFDIDLLHADKTDKTLKSICDNIDGIEPKPVDIPASFVLFENDVLQYLSEQKERKVKVMNFKECVQIGSKIFMTENVVNVALQYFHKNNIFLFFPDIGTGLIFFDPNALISIVDTIIQFSYMVVEGEGSIPNITRDDMDSLSKGIITEDLLKHKALAEIFVPGLYEPYHAIEILKKFYILAEGDFGKEPIEGPKVKKYMMMCLLPRKPVEKLEPLQKFKEIQPLRLHFGKGNPLDGKLCCSPSGSFGNMIACLISKHDWRIVTDMDDKEPKCLYHDSVMLHPKRSRLEVALINRTEYFEVDADVKGKYEFQACLVKQDVYNAAKSVLEKMEMSLDIFQGFICTCGLKTVPHTKFFIMDPERPKDVLLKCKYGHEEDSQTFWIGDTPGMHVLQFNFWGKVNNSGFRIPAALAYLNYLKK